MTVTGPPSADAAEDRRRWRVLAAIIGALAITGLPALAEPGLAANSTAPGRSATAAPVPPATAPPSITEQASASVPVGGSIFDSATLSGGTTPTGAISFEVFAPDDPTCSKAAPGGSSVPVSGTSGTYQSTPVATTTPGIYHFVATYRDSNNGAVTTGCAATGGVKVTQATPGLTTRASQAVAVGAAISDSASVTGGFNPTGTVTFALYAPGDPACTRTPVYSSTVAVGTGTSVVSAPYPAVAPGTYRWIASYGGDTNNAPVAGKCGDAGETVAVWAATPSLVTSVSSPSVAVGDTVSDRALLGGGFRPTGTITFRLYGPRDPACSAAPVFTSPAVPLAAPALSGPYRPTAPGTYRFIATYSGDGANNSIAGACTDPSEAVSVTAPAPAPESPPPSQTPPSQTVALPLPPTPISPTPQSAKCAAMTEAARLVDSVKAALTGSPGSAFKATCGESVRIVLRSREIRPGNSGHPLKNGYTTISNTLTHSTRTGQIAFSINPQGVALRKYAIDQGRTLFVFAIVHVRVDGATLAAEALRVFTLY